jgi:AsmA protein
MEANFEGRLGVADGLDLQGQTEVSLEGVRQVARWFGAGWPSGPTLKEFSIKGQLDWTSQSLAFERSTVRMDGNNATGALELNLSGNRPALVGTLALKTVDISPYLSVGGSEAGQPPFSWASFTTGNLGIPLGMQLDADLRISAERMQAANIDFGRSAVSISLRGGRLLMDVAELQFNGGFGSGQIGADFTGYRPKLALRGRLEQVDLGRTSTRFAGRNVVQGPATIVSDLTATGQTVPELIASLNGKLSVKTAANGRLGLDMKGLLAATQGGSVEGWSEAAKGTTSFDQLELRLNVRDGVVAVESAQLTAGETAWSAAGTLNIPATSMDLRVVAGAAPTAALAGAEIARLPGLQVRGPWLSPRIDFAKEADTLAPPLEPFEPLSLPAISLPDIR